MVTNTILQEEHMKLCPKLRVIDVSMMFAGLLILKLTVFIPTLIKKIFLIYREIQSGAFAKSYMRKGFLIYEEMRKYFPKYEEAVSYI